MSKSDESLGKMMELLVKEYPLLTSNAVRFALSHPREARVVVAAALERWHHNSI